MTWLIVAAPLALALIGLASAWVLKGRSGLEGGYEASHPDADEAARRALDAQLHAMRIENAHGSYGGYYTG